MAGVVIKKQKDFWLLSYSVFLKARFSFYVSSYERFYSSESTRRTNIKLSAIDHHLGVSVLKRLMTSSLRHNQRLVFKFTFLFRGKPFCA